MADSAQERKRQGQLEKKRQEMLAGYAEQRAALSAEASRDHTNAERFVKRTEGVEERMKRSTVGLVHAQDFKRIREELEEENRRKAAQTDDIQQEDKKRKKKKDKKSKMLSFGGDDDEDEAATAAAEEEGACGRDVVAAAPLLRHELTLPPPLLFSCSRSSPTSTSGEARQVWQEPQRGHVVLAGQRTRRARAQDPRGAAEAVPQRAGRDKEGGH